MAGPGIWRWAATAPADPGAALLATSVHLFVFLAYATTAAVARRVAAAGLPAAIRQGMDGIWLALHLWAVSRRAAGQAITGRFLGARDGAGAALPGSSPQTPR